MVKLSLKSTGKRDELSTTRNPRLCQDACQRLMLHPYITASRKSTAKTNMASVVKSKYLVLCILKDVVANTSI